MSYIIAVTFYPERQGNLFVIEKETNQIRSIDNCWISGAINKIMDKIAEYNPIEKIIVYGSSAYTHNIIELMTEKLDIPIEKGELDGKLFD